MKLLEFLETIRENDSSGPGKFVGARLTRDSERAIMRWMRDNGLRKKEPRARLHITVVGDKEQNFDWEPATFDPPLEIDSSTYKLEKFDDAIVLSFSVPELERRHEAAVKKYGINWKYPTYQPHLTLSFDETGLNNMDRLLKPTFPMYVACEYVQSWGFTEGDSSTERRRKTRMDEAFLAERNLMNPNLATEAAAEFAKDYFGRLLIPGSKMVRGVPINFTTPVEEGYPHIIDWAAKAMRKYLINDYPAAQILSFQSIPLRRGDDPNQIPGTAHVRRPQHMAYGLLSGSEREDEKMVVPAWVPAALERGDDIWYLDNRGLRGAGGIARQAQEVADWFRAYLRDNPRMAEPGRLNRMSWEQAVLGSEQYHARKKAVTDVGEELAEDREIYLNMDAGAAWWKLTGESCLTREGDLMGHCVGDYVDDVANGDVVILSLRDKQNNPHVTVELREGNELEIAQVKGKENEPPVEKYWHYVDALLKKLDSESKKLVVAHGDEGYHDLEGCGILALHGVFIRTNKDISKAPAWYRATYYPEYVKGHEDMDEREIEGKGTLDEIHNELSSGVINVLPEEEEYIQAWKMHLVIHGYWDTETESTLDNPNYDKDKHDELDPKHPQPWIDGVPVSVSVGLPGIEHEVLIGDPMELQRSVNSGYGI